MVDTPGPLPVDPETFVTRVRHALGPIAQPQGGLPGRPDQRVGDAGQIGGQNRPADGSGAAAQKTILLGRPLIEWLAADGDDASNLRR